MELKMKTGNIILGIVGIVGGLIILWLASIQNMPFLVRGMPGPGFLPMICGFAISLCSAWLMLESYLKARKNMNDKDLEKNLINKEELINFTVLIGTAWLVIYFTNWLGLLLSIGLAVIGLVRFYGKEKWLKSILIGAGTAGVMYLVFGMFLGVPLPRGIFGF